MSGPLLLILSTSLLAPGETGIVLLGPPLPGKAQHDVVASSESANGHSVVPPPELLERLCGHRQPRDPDLAALSRLLQEARTIAAEQRLKDATAMLREVVHAFETASHPCKELREFAARALHEMAAAHHQADNPQPQKARRFAAEAVRRFPSVPLDTQRHSPDVGDVFAAVRKKAARLRAGVLKVISSVAGDVWMDGRNVGRVGNGSPGLIAQVPVGTYRVWVATDDGSSLPHPAVIGSGQTTHLTIDPELDARIQLESPLRLMCTTSCGDDLLRLGQRLSVERLLGVRAGKEPESLEVLKADLQSGEVIEQTLSMTIARSPPVRPQEFSFLYFGPFGVAQFAQDRPWYGAVYAFAQVGFLTWHIWTAMEHEAILDQRHFRHQHEKRLRMQRNVSAFTTYGFVGATVLEALVVHLLDE